MTDDLRGTVEDLREIATELRKPSRSWWQYAVIVCGLAAIAGGCKTYIEFYAVSRAEYESVLLIMARQQREIETLREIQSIQMADPKWFNRIEAQNKAIREWRANEHAAATGHRLR